MDVRWKDGFQLSVRAERGAVVISGNAAGLRSLSDHLLALAEETPGSHIHYDAYNSLEDGSAELIVELESARGFTEETP